MNQRGVLRALRGVGSPRVRVGAQKPAWGLRGGPMTPEPASGPRNPRWSPKFHVVTQETRMGGACARVGAPGAPHYFGNGRTSSQTLIENGPSDRRRG